MVIGFTLFPVCIVVGGRRFSSGYTEQIAEWIQFLTAEQVDSISIVLAFFGGLSGLSIKYWMFASRKGLLIVDESRLSIIKESEEPISPTGSWELIIYKRNKPFRSKIFKEEIINRETDAILRYGRKKSFKFKVILTSDNEYQLFYDCIGKIKDHVKVKVAKITSD